MGETTGGVVQHILESRPHPEQGYRACLGLLSLGRRYTNARLEPACRRALKRGAERYKSVKSILAVGLDRSQVEEEEQAVLNLPQTHVHMRGADYYRQALGAGDARDAWDVAARTSHHAPQHASLETVIELPFIVGNHSGDLSYAD